MRINVECGRVMPGAASLYVLIRLESTVRHTKILPTM